ncbi:hypothetical protein SAMN05661080_02324 [Modestobacter sp. DSM 44400]|uniref:SDR family oxidoreductase n=1 Tax=Modestobacter sp. DSM 44400 TaxID=1550230 RepID=UPI00089CC7BC|nr:nucleoside-diphosphate sugar epimerase [Modestobacter sp. DSM 44400]SDY10533.1 hypothetical protein SAMN05661080_02324 [Modestobacter sp. DSM 44400]
MIVVTAAGGPTGTAVVRARDLPVRAVVARRGDRPELTALGAEVVVAELTAPMQWDRVLVGAQAMYLIWPNFDPDEAEGAPALFAEARRARLPRLVYHWVLHRPQLRAMQHHAAKDRAEEALDGSDLRDVAGAAAVLLTEDGLDGGTFEAAGPQALTAPRLAELIGARLGRDVVADDVVPGREVPTGYAARCARAMVDHYRAHGFAGSPRLLTALLGRPPRTYAEHLVDVLTPEVKG